VGICPVLRRYVVQIRGEQGDGMREMSDRGAVWLLIAALLALAVAAFALGWGSSLVHILGVLVVMLALYQMLRRRRPS
jgi:hypothetical protein